MRVLVLEDDTRMAAVLRSLLNKEGWEVDVASTVFQGIDWALSEAYDCAVVDVELPDGSGVDAVAELRQLGVTMPILMLTVHNETEDRVTGLNAGADDYMGKPFAPEELIARLHALVRRGAYDRTNDQVTRHGEAILFHHSRTLQFKGRSLTLSHKEYALLEYLFRHPGQVVTRDQLIVHVWGPEAEVADNALDTYIYFLRKKCASIGLKHLIRTVRGQGYMVAPVQG
jgi:DNA-binding response OmpR family regulator